MNISVFGGGHVGLVTAACLAALDHNVIVYDRAQRVIDGIASAKPHFHEPDLEELVGSGVASGRLAGTLDGAAAVAPADVVFICVDTPPGPDGAPDLGNFLNALRFLVTSAAERPAQRPLLIVEKSTIPALTSAEIDRVFTEVATERGVSRAELRCETASNPEFLREGSAVKDFQRPDRVVIGVGSSWAEDILRQVYVGVDAPMIVTDPGTAGLIKHASNTFLAMKISYANMLADLCDRTGADVRAVVAGVGLDERIGQAFLGPGIGWGGSCFPKDVEAFAITLAHHGLDDGLLRATARMNTSRIDVVEGKLTSALADLSGKTVAIMGLAFKPDTDDLRGSQPLRIAHKLLSEGATLRLFDPLAVEAAKALLPEGESVTYHTDPYEAVAGAHAVILATEWPAIVDLDWPKVHREMTGNVLLDGRNALEPATMRSAGFKYLGMGVASPKG